MKPKSIMLIDDEVLFTDNLKELLDRQYGDKVKVTTFNRATTALESIKDVRPDIIFSDNQMPGMTGMEFFDILLRDGSIPILVLMTGTGSRELETAARRMGIHEFIPKPVAFKQIQSILAEYFGLD